MSADQLAKLTQALSIEGFQHDQKSNANPKAPSSKPKSHARRAKNTSAMLPLLQSLKTAVENRSDKDILSVLGELIEVVTPTSSAPLCDAIASVEWSGQLFVDLLRPTNSSQTIQEKTAELMGYLSTHEKCSSSLARAKISEVATPVFLAHVKRMTEEKAPVDNLTRELLEALVNIVILPENADFLTQAPLFLHSLVCMVDTSLSVASKLSSLPEGFARQHHSMTYALHCLSNFANCEKSCEKIVDAHGIPVLMSVVDKGPFHVKPIALSCLMNLCVGQREAVTSAGALVTVMSILKDASITSTASTTSTTAASNTSSTTTEIVAETAVTSAPTTTSTSNPKKAKKKDKKPVPSLPTNLGPEPAIIEAALKLFCNLVEDHNQNAALARAMGTVPLLSGWSAKGAKLKGDQAVSAEMKDLAEKVLSYVEGRSADGDENGQMTAKCFSACFGCGKAEAVGRLKLCARCGVAKYCSRECQLSHWKSHKASCISKSAGTPTPNLEK